MGATLQRCVRPFRADKRAVLRASLSGAETSACRAHDFAGISVDLAHDVARGPRLRELVRLPGPQVEGVGVIALARGGAQRAGDVMDLGIGEGRTLTVLEQEAVDHPS